MQRQQGAFRVLTGIDPGNPDPFQGLDIRDVDTVYIGGGTPSLMSAWDMGKIMDALRENFNIVKDAEITIEGNPATLSDEKMERYLRKGINRLSLGVQSFENDVLQYLGRIHNKNDAFTSFQRARVKRDFPISIWISCSLSRGSR